MLGRQKERRSNKWYDWEIRRKYNLTLGQLNEMKISQDNKCKICLVEFNGTWNCVVDHCHFTNKVRGLLCRRCNTGLGMLQDSPALLQKAIQYLCC